MSPRPGTAAVILAAGLGTRMRSGRAKVLHRLGGLPLVTWSIRAVRPLADRVVVVVGHEREAVREELRDESVAFAVQDEQLGTGHALRCAEGELGGARDVIVLAGDVPRLTTASLRRLLDEHDATGASATLMTFRAADPFGYGRILRDAAGRLRAIVEEKLATPEERRIDECNAALYAFRTQHVLPLLGELPPRGRETYLTDAVDRLVADGRPVATIEIPEDEVAGINTQAQLAAAEARYRAARAGELMDAGVTLTDPAAVHVEADVTVGAGTTLQPFVSLQGRCCIGERCTIGPLVRLRDVTVGDGATLRGPLQLESSEVPPGAIV